MLGKSEIILRRSDQDPAIVIEPFNEKQLQPNSYDLRLGNWFIRQRYTPIDYSNVKTIVPQLDLRDEDCMKDVWNRPEHVIDNQIFILKPLEFVLSHTREIVGTIHSYSTLLKARSTLARVGLDVCASAGFGDVGYINHWTLALKNLTAYPLLLCPGMRLCQISFQEVDSEFSEKEEYHGIYNSRDEWKPEDMLPKLGTQRLF